MGENREALFFLLLPHNGGEIELIHSPPWVIGVGSCVHQELIRVISQENEKARSVPCSSLF